jgi:hypothetical protein
MVLLGAYSMSDRPTMLGCAKKDKWVGPFVRAIGGRMMHDVEEIYANTTLPMAYSGITKTAARTQAEKHGLDYWNIDTGYLGNRLVKTWFRITKNGFQVTIPIQPRPDDRLKRLRIDRTQFRRGNKIMIVPIDNKVANAYRLPEPDQWLQQTIDTVKTYTDRDIVIRQRPASREVRVTEDTFVGSLQQDINAVVVWASNCGVESAQHGIPVISLGPSACSHISGKVEQIDNLPALHLDLVESWLRWLSYNQFCNPEVESGLAWRTLQQNYEHFDQ